MRLSWEPIRARLSRAFGGPQGPPFIEAGMSSTAWRSARAGSAVRKDRPSLRRRLVEACSGRTIRSAVRKDRPSLRLRGHLALLRLGCRFGGPQGPPFIEAIQCVQASKIQRGSAVRKDRPSLRRVGGHCLNFNPFRFGGPQGPPFIEALVAAVCCTAMAGSAVRKDRPSLRRLFDQLPTLSVARFGGPQGPPFIEAGDSRTSPTAPNRVRRSARTALH